MLEIQAMMDRDEVGKIAYKPRNEVRVFNIEVEIPETESERENDEQEHEL